MACHMEIILATYLGLQNHIGLLSSDPYKRLYHICAEKIHEHVENVALTLGNKGSIIMHGGEAYPIEGAEANAIDTTGAGDMYAGALLYGITNGMGWQQAGHLASHAAARIVSQMGARLESKFSAQEVAQFAKMS